MHESRVGHLDYDRERPEVILMEAGPWTLGEELERSDNEASMISVALM